MSSLVYKETKNKLQRNQTFISHKRDIISNY